ncbi:MAG: HlyC/CorC family transporter [Gammaproteobacteria bacterium]|nr:HlyC/CorC family transporter [Gammaproteobacteria bacterium]
MSQLQLVIFSIVLVLLVLLSGFFSATETALMSINRYRLRHKARLNQGYAILILKLLKRPDRLLGMILIGNSLANIIASVLSTLLASAFFGDAGVVIATVILTFVILIFAEVAPKTVAALYPEFVSRLVAWPIYGMLVVFYPFVWFINFIANGVLRVLGIKIGHKYNEALSREELRSVVFDTAGRMSIEYQSMLLGILDLNQVTVDDVMIPDHEIYGIDINQPWEDIRKQLSRSPHDWVPIYRENINQVIGIVHLRELTRVLIKGHTLNEEKLLEKLHQPYFVPAGTPLNIQLMNFQQKRKRLALIVDEYGEIHGLVTLEDILEEIVGEFTTNKISPNKIEQQPDGSYLVDGAVTLRELNRVTTWQFPTVGPRTLNGLIIEELEAMPVAGIGLLVAGHPIEVLEVKDNRITKAQLFPRIEV